MMMEMIKKAIITVLLVMPGFLYSQAIDDFGTWWGVEIKKTFLKDFKAGLRAEVRLNQNSGNLKNFYLSPSFSYTPRKWLTLGVGYRFDDRYQQAERYFTQRHRVNIDVEFLYNVKRWDFEYRTRFQMHWEDYFDNDIEYPIMYNRNRLGVAFKWPQLPFKTSVSGELWLPLVSNAELSSFRLLIGQEYRLKEKHIFQLRFIFQTDLSTPEPVRNYIISSRYIFSF